MSHVRIVKGNTPSLETFNHANNRAVIELKPPPSVPEGSDPLDLPVLKLNHYLPRRMHTEQLDLYQSQFGS